MDRLYEMSEATALYAIAVLLGGAVILWAIGRKIDIEYINKGEN